MKDKDIRSILRKTELLKYIQDSHSKVVEELNIPVAKARIDMAVINGHLHGFEIKSAIDTLQRLPHQIEAYSKVFDFLTIVIEPKHYGKVYNLVPKWVGISVCSEATNAGSINIIRSAEQNENIESFFIAKLLWREELISILTKEGIPFKKTNGIGFYAKY